MIGSSAGFEGGTENVPTLYSSGARVTVGVRFFIVFEMASVISTVILMQPGLYGTYGYTFMWVYICRCNYACTVYVLACMHFYMRMYAYFQLHAYINVAFLHV